MFMWHDTTWMWLSMALFWSAVAVLAFYAMRAWSRPAVRHAQRRAGDLLDERYARGEISTEEYRQVSEALQRTAQHASDS
jgi:uncharacterized membrane protein